MKLGRHNGGYQLIMMSLGNLGTAAPHLLDEQNNRDQ
jgi:hypothetical protein